MCSRYTGHGFKQPAQSWCLIYIDGYMNKDEWHIEENSEAKYE